MPMIHPWGKFDWMFDKLDKRNWLVISSNSFEERCLALPLKLKERKLVDKVLCIDLTSPNAKFKDEISDAKSKNKNIYQHNFKGKIDFFEEDLLVSPSYWNDFSNEIINSNCDSIVIDITALPKRVFFFLIKKMVREKAIKNLVACYTRAGSYKEGKLTEDAEPPAALPGFAKTSTDYKESLVVVSVGYMSFNLNDYLEQGSVKDVKYMFPFPPGSPSFRRNWNLLHKISLTSVGETKANNIRRVHAMDMFAALDWLKEIRKNEVSEKSFNMDMIPLGPKTHALAMALNYLDYEDHSEVVYSQPRLYHPEYSKGVMLDADNIPEIYSYCLKVRGIKMF
ncbi:hypothetical protein [Vreelandella lutescens]|uniref:Uncharacterized protein n=1 Tax=Vreelandella lutescens TaxID=1602943 RepID=A0ABQ1NHL7_9GAMM|nr:hypothetical protein [Halomonas lutescens]GGC76711.1 hypothetical protein GCM10011382_03240 [Halomonas lutescens]